MPTKRIVFLVAFLLSQALALAQQLQPSEKLSYGVYTAQAGRVELVVGSYLARLEEAETFVPFQIVLGVADDGPELAVKLQNFELHDAAGNVYQPALPGDVAKSGINRMVQTWSAERPLETGVLFVESRIAESDFYPLDAEPYTRVNLEPGTYLRDVLYFPRPTSGLDGVLELSFYAHGMKGALNVVLEAPPLRKKDQKKAQKIRAAQR